LNSSKIVITGGPATGKTSIIQGLQHNGYHCFHEIIRDLTAEVKESGGLSSLDTNPINSVANPLEFNRKLLKGRTDQFLESQNLVDKLVFFDRGIPDVLAYMKYYKQEILHDFFETMERYKYDKVFLLPMWKEIFATDEERFENFEAALQIEDCLRQIYLEVGYEIIDVPFDSVSNRIQFILESVKK